MYLDLNDVDGVKDMGIYSWIQEKIELSQFVVILCSTGARFKCAKNRQFRMKQEREVWVYGFLPNYLIVNEKKNVENET